MEIGEHEECPEDDTVLLCAVEGCGKKAVWRIGDRQLCPVHLAELEAEQVFEY